MRILKIGAGGDSLRKAVQDVDDAMLGTIEHGLLYYGIEKMMPNNATDLRKLGVFLGISVAYNLMLSRVQSSESSGMNK